jgi:hypothetical protein
MMHNAQEFMIWFGIGFAGAFVIKMIKHYPRR